MSNPNDSRINAIGGTNNYATPTVVNTEKNKEKASAFVAQAPGIPSGAPLFDFNNPNAASRVS